MTLTISARERTSVMVINTVYDLEFPFNIISKDTSVLTPSFLQAESQAPHVISLAVIQILMKLLVPTSLLHATLNLLLICLVTWPWHCCWNVTLLSCPTLLSLSLSVPIALVEVQEVPLLPPPPSASKKYWEKTNSCFGLTHKVGVSIMFFN